jgi:hypothetical protein
MDEWIFCMCEWMNEGEFVCVMDEWRFWMCEWMKEGCECVNGWMKVNLYVWMDEWRLICVNGWTKVNLYVWMDEWRLICMCEWMDEG